MICDLQLKPKDKSKRGNWQLANSQSKGNTAIAKSFQSPIPARKPESARFLNGDFAMLKAQTGRLALKS